MKDKNSKYVLAYLDIKYLQSGVRTLDVMSEITSVSYEQYEVEIVNKVTGQSRI